MSGLVNFIRERLQARHYKVTRHRAGTPGPAAPASANPCCRNAPTSVEGYERICHGCGGVAQIDDLVTALDRRLTGTTPHHQYILDRGAPSAPPDQRRGSYLRDFRKLNQELISRGAGRGWGFQEEVLQRATDIYILYVATDHTTRRNEGRRKLMAAAIHQAAENMGHRVDPEQLRDFGQLGETSDVSAGLTDLRKYQMPHMGAADRQRNARNGLLADINRRVDCYNGSSLTRSARHPWPRIDAEEVSEVLAQVRKHRGMWMSHGPKSRVAAAAYIVARRKALAADPAATEKVFSVNAFCKHPDSPGASTVSNPVGQYDRIIGKDQ